MSTRTYTARNIFNGLTQSLHQYLEAQYHIFDDTILGERKRLLETRGVTYQEPRFEATPAYVAGRTMDELSIPPTAKKMLSAASQLGIGIYREPFSHQAKALESFLGPDQSDLIVATGTGSGKTESFLMPIVGTLAMEAERDPRSAALPGCRALLLYPMNALVNDQLARLRRLLGDTRLAQLLGEPRGRLVRFGMYTSRTPYPGASSSEKDERILVPLFEQLYNNISDEGRSLLLREGKWPAKDMEKFLASGFVTDVHDRELLTRREMQITCPDLLVTNYSMLEYMLLRPIESAIFSQTKEWLHSNRANHFIVVLDEAHMYRGAAGAEVAMLLRRLQSRLGAEREQFRYILTSASLGGSAEAKAATFKFANDLTNGDAAKNQFALITGEPELPEVHSAASLDQAAALAALDIEGLQNHSSDLPRAVEAFSHVLVCLGGDAIAHKPTETQLKDKVFSFLRTFGPAGMLTRLITGNPSTFDEISDRIFPGFADKHVALEALMAICNFARRTSDERVFLPIRMHLMYRGLSGIFACVNPRCSAEDTEVTENRYLGKLYDAPRLYCGCGGRVYELLTHRDCGASFIKGYMANDRGDFLWNEPTKIAHSDGGRFVSSQFLLEADRDRANDADTVWLHIRTGRIKRARPAESTDYVTLLQPGTIADKQGHPIVAFDGECPICLRTWRGDSKIMDLATKGEAPFAHLVKTQVKLQPASRPAERRFPNAGRKSLLFSDGRQKAARLARDIPREVERDVFRQAVVLAVQALSPREARLDSPFLYTGFLKIVSQFSLNMFDGQDNDTLRRDVSEFESDYGADLELAISDHFHRTPPPQYAAHLLRLLGSAFYSLSTLTIAHVAPTRLAESQISRILKIDENDWKPLMGIWIQSLLDRFALDVNIPAGIRASAAGYVAQVWGETQGFSGRRRRVIESIVGDLSEIEKVFSTQLATANGGAMFLRPDKLRVDLALDQNWFQCHDCTSVLPAILRGRCVNCGSQEVVAVHPNTSNYLRARKTFWRDPIVAMLNGEDAPFQLDVQEHTAQLNYRDVDDPNSTTEEFERRFRDILIHDQDTPVDVLSSTTTMEVGIDIGSLVAVGLRNVPPMRQNYQQRAGRAGRRGSAVSTVVTYAQNGPYDNFYFSNPEKIIAGDPPFPAVDTSNARIVERHVHAVLLQTFFHENIGNLTTSNNIFFVLGETDAFYKPSGRFSLTAFEAWLTEPAQESIYTAIEKWIPQQIDVEPKAIAEQFVDKLRDVAPSESEPLVGQSRFLIEFLFERGLLPSYAFPRDLCALQIESEEYVNKRVRVRTIERPQQSLNIALSEYAPGRFVVVNKKTYRIGSVTASATRDKVDRAPNMFTHARSYRHCPDCSFTRIEADDGVAKLCPLCGGGNSAVIQVIQPEVVYPEGGREVNELDDDQVYTSVTTAQLPLVDHEDKFDWRELYPQVGIASEKNQLLVMFNMGEKADGLGSGFSVCERCGKVRLPGASLGTSHERDYKIETFPGQRPAGKCTGNFRAVMLGYSFRSDVLLLRVGIATPLGLNFHEPVARLPIEDAFTSLSNALLLAAATVLDIDTRELNSGFRFLQVGGERFVDLFMYDTLSGGAGYAHMAAQVFPTLIEEAGRILTSCTCQSSCDKCLRFYGNRFQHLNLDRHLAYELLKYVTHAEVPAIGSPREQSDRLRPMAEMLALSEWRVSLQEHDAPLVAVKNGKRVLIGCYPGLIDPVAAAHPLAGRAILISEYELQRDLPGACLRIENQQ